MNFEKSGPVEGRYVVLRLTPEGFEKTLGSPIRHGDRLFQVRSRKSAARPKNNRSGIDPAVVFFDEFEEFVHGRFCRYVAFDNLLAAVEGDFPRAASDITVIGIGHLARAVDNAAHDPDFYALEVVGAASDSGGGLLKVEEGATTGGAGDVFGFGDASARGL